MELDKTQIAIRERGTWELMDLALRVIWHYGRELLVYASVLTIPIALFNWWVLHSLVAEEYTAITNARYIGVMAQVIFLEAPLTSLATTIFLGSMMFRHRQPLPTDRRGRPPRHKAAESHADQCHNGAAMFPRPRRGSPATIH